MNKYIGKLLRAGLLLALAGLGLGQVSGKEQWAVYDPLGNTLAMTNAEAVVADVESTAFGENRTPTVGTRFTGKPYDADLGAHVFPFRNYRSDAGCWTSADPCGFPDGVNHFAYAPNVNLNVDPLGLATFIGPSGSPSPTSVYNIFYPDYTYTVTAGNIFHEDSAKLSLPAWTGLTPPWTVENGGNQSGTITVTNYFTSEYEGRASVTMTAKYDGVTPRSGYVYHWIQMITRASASLYSPDNSSDPGVPFYPLDPTGESLYLFTDTPGISPDELERNYDYDSNGPYLWTGRLFLTEYNSTTNDLIIHDGIGWSFNVIRTE